MIEDPIVDEVRKHRQAYAAKFHFDVRAIAADAQREERKSGRPLVSFVKSGRKPAGRPARVRGSSRPRMLSTGKRRASATARTVVEKKG